MKNIINTRNITVSDKNRDNIETLKESLAQADFQTGKMLCDAFIAIVLDIIENGKYRRHPVYTGIIVDLVSGEIFREDKRNPGIAKKAQISPRTDGYYRVKIEGICYYVHRIIMEAFLGELIEPTENGPSENKHASIDVHHCMHSDCAINSIYNLRLVSHSKNCSVKNIAYNAIDADGYEIIKEDEVIAYVNFQREVAELLGGTQSAVSKACRGVSKSFHGYIIRPIYADIE